MDPIEAAAVAVKQGRVIVYPTDTLWGLGASIRDDAAVRRVFEIKDRPTTEPLSIAVASVAEINEYAVLTPSAKKLTGLLPGPLTIILKKRPTVSDVITGGNAKVGVRVPDHPECLALLRRTGALTTTSANLHGKPEPKTVEEIRGVFGDRVGFYLDAGSSPVGRPSTIVDASVDPFRILRTGVLSESRIREHASY